MTDKKYHYMYEITNLINGKIYVGVHSYKTRFDENYYGSGTLLKRAVKKWTKDVFHIKVLEYFDNHEDALFKERFVVDEAYVLRKDTYNLKVGGEGGSLKGKKRTERTKQRMRKPKTEEHKKHISESKTGVNNPMYGHVYTEEERKIKSEENKGQVQTEESNKKRSKSLKGKSKSNKAKKAMSYYWKNIAESKICPHCSKSGTTNVMYRHHFDNCKLNPANHLTK